jgi:hypothetical protein
MENDVRTVIRQRVQIELDLLSKTGNIQAELVSEGEQDYVLFKDLETSGGLKELPVSTSVLVPVPAGYPSSPIDMPAIPSSSILIPHLVGGSNPQGFVSCLGQSWSLLSFHPYSGTGAPNWNPNKHGFHNYYQHLYTWLHKI